MLEMIHLRQESAPIQSKTGLSYFDIRWISNPQKALITSSLKASRPAKVEFRRAAQDVLEVLRRALVDEELAGLVHAEVHRVLQDGRVVR